MSTPSVKLNVHTCDLAHVASPVGRSAPLACAKGQATRRVAGSHRVMVILIGVMVKESIINKDTKNVDRARHGHYFVTVDGGCKILPFSAILFFPTIYHIILIEIHHFRLVDYVWLQLIHSPARFNNLFTTRAVNSI